MEEKKSRSIFYTFLFIVFGAVAVVAAYLIGNKNGQETIVNGTDAAINQAAIDKVNNIMNPQ